MAVTANLHHILQPAVDEVGHGSSLLKSNSLNGYYTCKDFQASPEGAAHFIVKEPGT
jgi:hypothetical protein